MVCDELNETRDNSDEYWCLDCNAIAYHELGFVRVDHLTHCATWEKIQKLYPGLVKSNRECRALDHVRQFKSLKGRKTTRKPKVSA